MLKEKDPLSNPLPSHQPVFPVPDEWTQLYDLLQVIRTFTLRIEEDLVLQQIVFIEARNIFSSLEELHSKGNLFANQLKEAFEGRFVATADLLIAELAYRFTLEGLLEWRASYSANMDNGTEEEKVEATQHYNSLKERYISLCESVFNITTDSMRTYFGFEVLFNW